jgi:hypothetical protein
LWRARPEGGLFVGGFARVARLRAADFQCDAAEVTAAAAAGPIMDHCNRDHPDALARIAGSQNKQQVDQA